MRAGIKMATGGAITSLWSMLTEIDLIEVPDFQRNYAWDVNNVTDLYQDIKNALESERNHFVGSTILMTQKSPGSQDKKHVYVVDGQQRLTSIFMLVSVIRDSVVDLGIKEIKPKGSGVPINVESKCHEFLFSNEETGEQRFRANTLIAKMFSSSVVSYPDDDRPDMPKKHHNHSLPLRKAYWRLQILIAEDLKQVEDNGQKLRFLWNLLRTIKDSLQILKITTDTYEESLDVFMTLNSRGKDLGPSDLIKSELFKNLSKFSNENDIESFSSTFATEWKELLASLSEADVDVFLRHYLLSIVEGALQAKLMPSKVKSILIDYSKKAKGDSPDLKLAHASSDFFDELKASAELYGKIVKAQEHQTLAKTVLKPVLAPLLILENSIKSHRILFLSLLHADTNLKHSEMYEIARAAEIVGMRWVVSGSNAQELENLYQKAALGVRQGTPDVKKIVDEMMEKLPSDLKCKVFFEEPIDDATFVRTVLYRMNQLRADSSKLISYSASNIQVEHIAPSTYTKHWLPLMAPGESGDDQVKSYETIVENWGNKTILDSHINNGVKQHPFEMKRDGFVESEKVKFEGYKASVISMTNDLQGVRAWSPQMVDKRNKWIGELFVVVWGNNRDLKTFPTFADWLKTNPQ